MTPLDDLSFIGPPMFRGFMPEPDEIEAVHISVTFTWDIQKGKELAAAWGQYYPVVLIGGPAFGDGSGGFIPGEYIKQGVTFTSRGCNNNCSWCLVPGREGTLHEIEDFAAGNIIQDNNLLQCSQKHLDRVIRMLQGEPPAVFSGGLDARLITDRLADALRGIKLNQLFLACDTRESIKALRRAVAKLNGLSRDILRCYVLIAYKGESISDANERLEEVWAAGCMPFAQLYQPTDKFIRYSHEWRKLARDWSRPAIMKSNHRVFKGGDND